MIDKEVQARLERILQGKEPRDREWEDRQAKLGHIQEEALARAKYEREHPPPRSHRELELEQRAFNLRMFGKSAMEYYARPLEMDELSVPSVDAPVVRLQEHSSEQRPVVPAHLKLKCHHGEPIRQVLQLV
ncbi:MAG: hypothetical protein ACYDHX_12745 [Methanothrix sp.]